MQTTDEREQREREGMYMCVYHVCVRVCVWDVSRACVRRMIARYKEHATKIPRGISLYDDLNNTQDAPNT